MEKGLYKNDNCLMYAQLSVNYPNGTILNVSDYEGHEGEIYDGWRWFDSRQQALDFFGITENQI
jgi:hypothetical protein